MAISKSSKSRLMIGLPLAALIMIMMISSEYGILVFQYGGHLVALYELSQLNNIITGTTSFKYEETKKLKKFLNHKFDIYMALLLTAYLLVPVQYLEPIHNIGNALGLLLNLVLLLLFVKFEMNGKYENKEVNIELARATYTQTAFDCVKLVWLGTTSKSMIVMGKLDFWDALGLSIMNWTFVSETSALVIGKIYGKTDFSYFVSPKKTIEGLLGQYFGIVISVFLYYTVRPLLVRASVPDISFLELIIQGVFTVTLAVMGDLFESLIKRAANIKHSTSTLGVGMGGILDKYDGISFSAIALTFSFQLLFGVGLISPK